MSLKKFVAYFCVNWDVYFRRVQHSIPFVSGFDTDLRTDLNGFECSRAFSGPGFRFIHSNCRGRTIEEKNELRASSLTAISTITSFSQDKANKTDERKKTVSQPRRDDASETASEASNYITKTITEPKNLAESHTDDPYMSSQ